MLVCCREKEKGEREKEKVVDVEDLRYTCPWRGSHKDACIYNIATEWLVLSFENSWNLFSVLVIHIHFTESLSDENRDSKLIQTSAERWDPHDLDDENKKLSDITQNSLHPNEL